MEATQLKDSHPEEPVLLDLQKGQPPEKDMTNAREYPPSGEVLCQNFGGG